MRVHLDDRVRDGRSAHTATGCLLRLPVAGAGLIQLRFDQRVRPGRCDEDFAFEWLAGDDRKQNFVGHGRAGVRNERFPKTGINRPMDEHHTHRHHRQAGDDRERQAYAKTEAWGGGGQVEPRTIEHDVGDQATQFRWTVLRDDISIRRQSSIGP